MPRPTLGARFLGLAALLSMICCSQVAVGQDGAFSHAVVERLASGMAAKAFEPPPERLPQSLANLDYDQYRQLRVRQDRAIWRNEALKFELQVLPTGWLFKAPIQINIVDGGSVQPIAPNVSFFDVGTLAAKLEPDAQLGFSGFRITHPLNRIGKFDELLVFQGASYFRALSRNQIYGASARGLALNVAGAGGEEFPIFRQFWIEKPAPAATQIIIHALLDSPSTTGAYRFVVTPGSPTRIGVELTLYPRRDLVNVGLAPLTSMFLFSENERSRIRDFRPAVHDSDALAIRNGWDENLWRPLSNPRRLQSSTFVDNNPRGFGLIQRSRSFAQFQDLEARYEARPSFWIDAVGDWGPGGIELIEIRSDEEIHDNIVALWKPSQPLGAGKAHRFAYRISTPDDVPLTWPGARVHATRSGLINGPQRQSGAIRFVVDFVGIPADPNGELPTAVLDAKAGSVSPPVVQTNPEINGLRVAFVLDPKGQPASELRLSLQSKGQQLSETWLYRWTKD